MILFYQYHYSRILNVFESSFHTISTYRVPSGENSKNVHQFSEIVDFILKEGVERKTPILAVGGGVVGDLSGFVAASVLRGVPLVHMPTSLLAMVDSSIGGKTGINHSTGKKSDRFILSTKSSTRRYKFFRNIAS